VNSCDFYSYRLIGKLTVLLQLQEFTSWNMTVTTSSTSVTRLSLHNSRAGLTCLFLRLQLSLTNFSSINLVFIFRFSSSPRNQVTVSEKSVDPSALVFSLSSHRHSEIGFIKDSS
jgi:hypothetical protein